MENRYIKKQLVKFILSVIAITVILCVFTDSFSGVLETVIGYAIAWSVGSAFDIVVLMREDKNKISGSHYHYDDSYRIDMRIGDKDVHFWYEPLDEAQDGERVIVEDDPDKNFTVDPLIQANYLSIIQAHKGSYFKNDNMIRLEDCIHDKEAHTVTIRTGRTCFFNDLVTNRSMDFEISDGVTVRSLFEYRPFLVPLSESKMSNHIGINVIMFHRGKMIFAYRGNNATLSKKKVTSTIAVGLRERDILALGHRRMTEQDVLNDVIIFLFQNMLSDGDKTFAERNYCNGLIKPYYLGFGRLIYTGGKPQFYYAVVVDDSIEDIPWEMRKDMVDSNRHMVYADGLTVTKEHSFNVRLKRNGKRDMRVSVERSFFVNYWHLIRYPRIEGVPDWVYDAETYLKVAADCASDSVSEEQN